MSDWTDEIRARADAATPGTWINYGQGWITVRGDERCDPVGVPQNLVPRKEDDSEFIANARRDIPRLLDTLDKIKALHRRVTRWGSEDYSISADDYSYSPGDYAGLSDFEVCAECYRVEQTPDQHDGECLHSALESLWPCDTARAWGEGDE